jgi:hypothetical protein
VIPVHFFFRYPVILARAIGLQGSKRRAVSTDCKWSSLIHTLAGITTWMGLFGGPEYIVKMGRLKKSRPNHNPTKLGL